MNLYDSILASQPNAAFKWNAAGTTVIDATNRGATAGVKARTNLSVNPRGITNGVGYSVNSAYWTNTYNQAVTGHPQGITTAVKSTVSNAASALNAVTSLYNLDTLNSSTISRGVGVWVWAPKASTAACYMTDNQVATKKNTSVPASTWTFVTTLSQGTGNAILTMTLTSGNTVNGDYVFITGAVAMEGTVPTAFFDGTAGGGTWTGAANTSTSTLNDVSPYGSAPIAATDFQKSVLIGQANVIQYSCNVFKRGQEKSSFAIESWFYPNTSIVSPLSILSHDLAYDGLWFDGDKIHFDIDFETTGSIDLTWPVPDFPDAMHIVGNYTPGKMQLLINGEVVSEADVSDARIKDGFKTRASSSLWAGQHSDNAWGAQDGVAFYTKSLTDAEVYNHFRAGRRVVPSADLAGFYGGIEYDSSRRDVFVTKQWTGTDWQSGLYVDVDFQTNALEPIEDSATLLTKAGTWTGTYEVEPLGTNLYGAQVDWDGDGSYVVEASLNDGANWTTLVNGRVIPGTYNWAVAGKIVLIRVRFTGGLSNDASQVRRLRVTGYSSPKVYSTDNSRSLTLTGEYSATNPDRNEPIENNSMAGFELSSTAGYMYIGPDTEVENPQNIRTIEVMWRALETTPGKYIFDTRTSGGTEYLWFSGANASGLFYFGYINGTLYVDGVATASSTFTPVLGKWYHLVYVLGTSINTNIDFSSTGNKQLSVIHTYASALTAADALSLFKGYSGYPSAALGTDSNPITEPASPYRLYAYDWSISPAG